MLLPKDVLNNFTKTKFSLRDIIKIVSDQLPAIPNQPVIFMQNLHNMISVFNQ